MGREQRINAKKKRPEKLTSRIKELEKEVALGNANIQRLQKEINRLTLSVAMRRGAIEELVSLQGKNNKKE